MTRAAVALVVSLVIAGVRPAAIAVQPSAVTIPFELVARRIVVTVVINNSRPLSVVPDTSSFRLTALQPST